MKDVIKELQNYLESTYLEESKFVEFNNKVKKLKEIMLNLFSSHIFRKYSTKRVNKIEKKSFRNLLKE